MRGLCTGTSTTSMLLGVTNEAKLFASSQRSTPWSSVERNPFLLTGMIREFVGFANLSRAVVTFTLSILLLGFDDHFATFDACFDALRIETGNVELNSECFGESGRRRIRRRDERIAERRMK